MRLFGNKLKINDFQLEKLNFSIKKIKDFPLEKLHFSIRKIKDFSVEDRCKFRLLYINGGNQLISLGGAACHV